MNKLMVLGLAVPLALGVGVSCKKEEAAKPAEKPKKDEKPPEKKPEPPKTLTGAELGKWYVDCWAAWGTDWDKFEKCYDPGVKAVMTDSGMPELVGAKAVVENGKMFKAAFPDFKGEVQQVFVSGRWIAATAFVSGTNSGAMKSPMGEMPATGKKVGMLIFHLVEVNDANQVTREWFIQDQGTMMNQLGMNPNPGRPVMDKGMDGAPMIIVAADNDVEKANLALYKADVDGFNKQDVKAAMANAADDMVESDQASEKDAVGKKEVEKGLKMFKTAFPDGKLDPAAALFAAGDYVVAVGSFTGTNKGDMGPMKATNKPVTITVAEIFKYEGGKVKQSWRFYNGMGFAMQLGLIDPSKMAPPPAGGDKGAAPAPGGEMKKEGGAEAVQPEKKPE